jgi:pimeloyl-ACP methyl ester carboxylesterase
VPISNRTSLRRRPASRQASALRRVAQAMIWTVLLCVSATGTQAAEVQSDRASVHYTVRGRGPTVVFVHGWTCTEGSWSRQVPTFARRYRVVTLDLPGHGRSAPPARGDYSIASFARAVEAVRAAVHAPRIVLVGHSMGVTVIRRFALDHPERVAGLVAVDGPLDVRAFAEHPVPRVPLSPTARRALVDSMFGPAASPRSRREITSMMMSTSDATAQGSSWSMFDPANQSERIIPAPALTIYAGRPLFPIAPRTKELIPNWAYTQVAGTGHFVMIERPREFNRLLASFLSHRARFQP